MENSSNGYSEWDPLGSETTYNLVLNFLGAVTYGSVLDRS